MRSVKKNNLSLLFTRKVSLSDWIDLGIVSRELFIYNIYLKKNYFKNIYLYTYGYDDYNLSLKLKKKGLMHENIFVLPKKKFLGFKINNIIYSILLVFFYKKHLINSTVKTNQIDVGFSAIFIKLLYNKEVILRGGYIKSSLLKNTLKFNSTYIFNKYIRIFKYRIIKFYEEFSINLIGKVILSNYEDRNFLIKYLNIKKENIYVIPSFINTNIFRPKTEISKRSQEFLYIGRLSEEKNLFNVIQSVCGLGYKLNIIGSGKLEIDLKKFVNKKKYNVIFHSNIPNEKLPKMLNQYKFFILGSLSEGLPKVLLEAMSCGLICFVNNIPAIKNLIKNYENGIILKNVDKTNLELAINSLSNKKENLISYNSVRFITDFHSVSVFINKEIKLIQQNP